MIKRMILMVVSAALLFGCAGMEPYGASTPVDRGQSPIILDAYAGPFRDFSG